MKEYDIFITNRRDGVHHRTKKLGRVEAYNKQAAEYVAFWEFSDDIWTFCQAHGTDSIIFPITVIQEATT